jgi:ribosome-associated protein
MRGRFFSFEENHAFTIYDLGVSRQSKIGRENSRKIIRVYPCSSVVKLPPLNMDSKKLALLCREFADNKKAEDIAILDVRELSSVTDYFVIASGTSEPHLRAIVNEITDRLRDDYELRPRAVDGALQTAWVVLDYFDVIVHVMRQDVRERYDLETLWGDAPRVVNRKKSRSEKS